MKQALRKIFTFILNYFESGTEEYAYKSSHRTILIAFGILFSLLALGILWLAQGQDIGYLLPVVVFGGAGLVSIIVGTLGTDRAVAKIWGSQR